MYSWLVHSSHSSGVEIVEVMVTLVIRAGVTKWLEVKHDPIDAEVEGSHGHFSRHIMDIRGKQPTEILQDQYCISSCCSRNKLPHMYWLEATWMYSLTVRRLEVWDGYVGQLSFWRPRGEFISWPFPRILVPPSIFEANSIRSFLFSDLCFFPHFFLYGSDPPASLLDLSGT